MVEYPLGDRQVGSLERRRVGRLRSLQAPARVRQQHGGAAGEGLGDVLDGEARQVVEGASGGKLPAHGVQERGAPLARARHPRLGADVGHQVGDDEREHEHDDEGDEVFQIAHRKGEARRHEAKIQGDHVRGRGQARGSPSEPQRRHGGAQQVHHHEIRQREIGVHDEPGGRTARADGKSRPVTLPFDLRRDARSAAWLRRFRPARTAARDHGDVEAAAAAHQLRGGRAPQPRAPAHALRLAGHDAGDVAQPGVLEERIGGGGAVDGDGFGAQRFRQLQHVDAAIALDFGQLQKLRRLDRHDDPLGIERVGEALADAHQLLRLPIGRDRDQKAVARQPRARGGRLPGELERGGVHAVGRAAQRQLAQGE